MLTFFHFQDCYKVILVFALSSIGFFFLFITILSKEWEHEKIANKRMPSEFFYVSFLCGALVSLLAVFLIDFNNMQGEKEKSVKIQYQLVAKALDVNENDIVFHDFEDSEGEVQENQKGYIIKKLDKQYVVIFDNDIKTTKIIRITELYKITETEKE
ncbi:hypothetical protein [Bacillus cereus group sp. BfR-BA-02730]|uniref:hypothetical protein n=1 Tax=Bacillus cereus group sp. BfR-BA-02730 TaxID=3094893 RepID=UPI0029C3C7CE|nr:hypothetical protein [Bacillus cereus group sp. BfR-BA-02730]MDX5808341.1 hypothetical protein [Bacillus cereus group sp. BfR-BA-02730]